MGRTLRPDEVAELLGAFVLGAVDAQEAAAIRRHLVECPLCAEEVAQYREALMLPGQIGGDVPPYPWERISGQLGRQPSQEVSPLGAPATFNEQRTARNGQSVPSHRVRRSIASGVAAAFILVITLLGIQVERLDHRVGQLASASEGKGLTQAAHMALVNPNAHQVTLTDIDTKSLAMEVVILPSGMAYVINRRLPSLPQGRTYQLWGRLNGQSISLGILGNRPAEVAVTIPPTAHFSAYAVSAEHAGGVVSSTHVPIAVSRALR